MLRPRQIDCLKLGAKKAWTFADAAKKLGSTSRAIAKSVYSLEGFSPALVAVDRQNATFRFTTLKAGLDALEAEKKKAKARG